MHMPHLRAANLRQDRRAVLAKAGGTADFIAEVVVQDLKAYEKLLMEPLLTLPMIARHPLEFSIRRIKADAPLPLVGF
jgi:DNA-binding Lrp family transcriptional regulator